VAIGAMKPNDIRTLPYSANLQGGLAMYSQLKNAMRENSGALGALQGLGIGVDRGSATEAEKTFAAAGLRPELMASNIEKNCLPRLGQAILDLYREYLTSDEELAARIGEDPASVSLASIHAPWDVQFIGSRQASSAQARLAFFDRVIQLTAQVPQAALQIDMSELITRFLEDSGYESVSKSVGNADVIRQNAILQRLAGPPSPAAGNGGNPTKPTSELPPAQVAGTTVIQ